MKRKAADTEAVTANGHGKKRATEANGIQSHFRHGLFAPDVAKQYHADYDTAGPYKHAVVSDLFEDSLLRSVRSEILENIHFTPKETDIYKIHQSGDLANLDGLPASALEKLPSMLKLRDALYSYDFRQWLSQVTGAGALSGSKTDMAVNVYVPGCHLLCHDDVIGSRRVSYILYLTDPDTPWQAEWGGALRLYPTEEIKDESGKAFKVPKAEWSKVIPPAWNQLSFFAVQPGESFHDVEEVYKRMEGESEKDGGRFRMAISGWFHIPQEGEEGFEPGLEEKLAEKSSLQQLQGKAAQFDEPQIQWHDPDLEQKDAAKSTRPEDDEDIELKQADLEFLLKFMTPNYLTPDTCEELNEMFAEESTLQLTNFLNAKFAGLLQEWLQQDEDQLSTPLAKFATSRPPHKHRYQYMEATPIKTGAGQQENGIEIGPGINPFHLVLNHLLPSLAFRKWLSLATGLTLKKCSVLARRFRRGLDYQLAQGYDGEEPQLEYSLNITPTTGWGGEEDAGDEEEEETNGQAGKAEKANSKAEQTEETDNVGGYELYMAGDDDDGAEDDADGSDDGVEIPSKIQSQTGAGDRRNAKRGGKKADPAIYKAAAAEEEDDGILVSQTPSWNTLSVVLRDQGTLKFVKYVSSGAPGDRWDFTGCVEVEPGDDDDDDEEEEVEA